MTMVHGGSRGPMMSDGKSRDAAPVLAQKKLGRRRFLKWGLLSGVGVVVGGAVDAVLLEPRWVSLTRPVISIDALPSAWDGVPIAHLTDIHTGRLIGLDYVRKVVEMTLAQSPDIIALTGDFVTGVGAITPKLARVLGRLRAAKGQFAVLGNHDHWADAEGVRSLLNSAGITLLTNRNVVLEENHEKLCLAGVGDLWEDEQLLDAALAGVPEQVPRILLCHNPDYAEAMPSGPRVDLMLCGHTHGGQFKIPFGPRPQLPVRYAKYAAGLARGPCCPVYTSRGLGMVGVPIRFNCRPELAIITLCRARQ